MLAHQQGKVGVFGVLGLVLIAVAVDGDDAVGVLVHHHAVGVHAEGADHVLKFFRAVDDLALVKLVGQVGKHLRRKLHAHADIHPVGVGGDAHIGADRLHPLAAAAAHGDNALAAAEAAGRRVDLIAFAGPADAGDGGIEMEIHLFLQLSIEIFQHHIVYVGA